MLINHGKYLAFFHMDVFINHGKSTKKAMKTSRENAQAARLGTEAAEKAATSGAFTAQNWMSGNPGAGRKRPKPMEKHGKKAEKTREKHGKKVGHNWKKGETWKNGKIMEKHRKHMGKS